MTLPLPSQGNLVGIVFLIQILVTITGAFIAVNSERLIRSVAGVIVCFIGVAGLYFFLNSPFVAMMQILIYVGAVAITISFAIMLAAPEEYKSRGPANILVGPLGIISAALLFIGLAYLAIHTEWPVHAKINSGSVEVIGTHLLTSYAMVFELISIVLLVAILGALVLARRGRSN